MAKVILFILVVIPLFGTSQINLDSLWNVWEDDENIDTVRLEALCLFTWKGYANVKPDSGLYFSEVIEKYASNRKRPSYIAKAISYKGSCYSAKRNYEKSIKFFNQANEMFKDIGEDINWARTNMNLGNVFVYKGESKKALGYYLLSLDIFQKNKDTSGVIHVYNNMGVISENMGNYKLSIEYHLKSLEMAEDHNDLKSIGNSYLNLGGIYEYQGKYEEAEKYALKSLELNKKNNDIISIGHSYNNIGNIATHRGDIKKAINFYNKSLKSYEKADSKYDMARVYGNLGAVYKDQNEPEIALKYYKYGLNINSELDNKEGLARSYNKIGGVYEGEGNYVKAVYFFNKSLNLAIEVGDKRGVANTYINLGNVFLIMGDNNVKNINKVLKSSEDVPDELELLEQTNVSYQEAENAFDSCFNIYKELESEIGVARTLMSKGRLNFKKGNNSKSILLLDEALDKAKEIGNLELEKEASKLLYENYKISGDFSKALVMNECFIRARDSLRNKENQKALIRHEFRSEYEKQATIDSLENSAIQKNKEIEIIQQKLEIESQNIKQYILFGGLALVFLFAVYFIKKNKEIKEQKKEFDKQRKYAEEQHSIAEEQKSILGKQHIEIKDSIQYAQNLQKAVLPSKQDVNKNFKDNFIVFKPKDVVSGDFYWTYSKEEVNYLAVVDCTGHGVPGAFMTIVANNLLNEIIKENFLTPKEIVEELHKRIKIRVGGHKEAQVRDSMDLGLLSFNKSTNEVRFVGTHTSIYRVRNSKLEKIKGSKADIGYKKTIEIEEQVFQVEANDMLYFHTDGYPDQKGGPKGKKFYYKPIRDKFEEISLLNLMEQEQIMWRTFEDWKGDLEQLDDVCMIGVRI